MKNTRLVSLALLTYFAAVSYPTSAVAMSENDDAAVTAFNTSAAVTATALPQADLFDFQFNVDGSINDLSTNQNKVSVVANNTVVNETSDYGMPCSSFDGNNTSFYVFNYEKSKEIKNAFKNKFSIELLYSPSFADKDMCPLGAQEYGGFRFGQTKDGKIQFIIGLETFGRPGVNRKYHTVESKTTVEANKYYHVVATFIYNKAKNDVINLYVNGQLETTLEVPGNAGYFHFPSGQYRNIAIGGDFHTANDVQRAFYGKMLMARMYAKNLEQSSVEALFAATEGKKAVYTANEAMNHTGVGYPKATEQEALKTAIEQHAASEGTLNDHAMLFDAVAAYKSSSNINLPENGKAYTFTNINVEGAKRYLSYNEGTLSWAENSQNQAAFVCRQLENGKYAFVNNAGKFLIWAGTENGGNNNKGYNDSYTHDGCDFTLAKMQTGENVSTTDITDLFGFVTLQAKNPADQEAFITVDAQGAFTTQTTANFNKENSSAILLEEVPYANVVTLKSTNGIEGADYLATFSAPFATILPEGITAYYAAEQADNGNTIVMKSINGNCIPAHQGVLLAANTNETITLCPATDETVTELGTNLLGHSAGKDKILETADNAYILGAKNGVVAFYKGIIGSTLPMNRAYLPLSAEQAVMTIKFIGDATGIESVGSEGNANAPIYDLAGRRVNTTTKGGIYIQNGKKFIVK